VPKAPVITTWRSKPIRLLSTKAAITVPAARAIWRVALVDMDGLYAGGKVNRE